MDKNYEQIELRSEKVRNIIGHIPPLLIRSGITLIALLITGLAVAACFIPFPENVKGKVEVAINSHSEIEITAFIPYTKIARIKEGMPASIEMEGYTTGTDSHLNGKVKTVYKEVLKKRGKLLPDRFKVGQRCGLLQDEERHGGYCSHSIIRPQSDGEPLSCQPVQVDSISIFIKEDSPWYREYNTEIISFKSIISALLSDYKQVIMKNPSTISS